jgi:hypothetical protein
MAKIISAIKFDTTIGPVRLTGVLFLADPRSDSFAMGDAEILGLRISKLRGLCKWLGS